MRLSRTATTIALAATTLLAFTGCGRGEDEASSGQSATLVMSTLNNPFFVSVADGAKDGADDLGIELSVENANNSDQTALDLTIDAVTQDPDVLIIDPVSSEGGAAMVKQANQASVPVMAFDRRPASGDLANFIGYDAIAAGREGAKSLAEAIGEKGTVVEIQGIMGTNVAQDRSEGFQEEMGSYPGIDVVATQAAEFDRGQALDVMTNILQANPDIDGVYAANDEMALGVVAALESRGLTGKVQVVGNDGIADALAAVAAGDMYSTHAESPYALGKEVIKIADAIASGDAPSEDEVLQGTLVKKADVPDYCAEIEEIGDTETCQGL
ncbi:MAG: substrate-binding domain-containing protein [Nocardioidaceae bacterium]|nr:substrate-binding domain-containing protein [Nocardioidaceae bacterium]